jgi:PKD repeat protein
MRYFKCKLKLFLGVITLSWFFLHGMVYSQVRNCDFNGTAKIRGIDVTGSDDIKAYDPGNQLCGTAFSVGSGQYAIHVAGDDPSTPGVDEGASDGDQITFKINGETANVVSGSNTWYNMGSFSCNIEIPDLPPESDPGGPYSESEGSVINFDGSGSIGAATYSWDFGDGNSGSGMSPSHTYVDDGTYTVTLTIENNSSQTDVETTTANISNVAPSPDAGSDKTSDEGDQVSFSGSATDPGVNDVLIYSWDFGDGGSASGQNVNHTYVDDGVFNVTLSVDDGDGGIGTDQLTVTVNNISPQNVEAGNNQTTNEGTAVSFSGSATDPGVNDVLTYNWNFGDGQGATGQNVGHTYGDNGNFQVVLTVDDGDGGAGADNLTVTVNNVAPTASAGGPYSAVMHYPLQFNGSATDPGTDDVLTYEWDLDDDGQYDDYTGRYPVKTYTSAGTYNVSLRVTDDDGGSDTDNTTVEVSEGIEVTVSAGPGVNMQIIVDNQTYTSPHTFYWIPDSEHELEAPKYQGAGGYDIRYRFQYWNDGGNRIRIITVQGSAVTYHATYAIQYWLKIDDGGIGANPVGEGWYYPGTQVNISVDTLVTDSQGSSRFRFQEWSGIGAGSYNGMDLPALVTVNGPIVQTVNWGIEYYLQVVAAHGTTTTSGWYEAGTDVDIYAEQFVDNENGSRHLFQSWEGDGEGSYTGTDNPASVQMNGPIVETAIWQTQYLLSVISTHGNPTGEGWYDEGATAAVSIDTTVESGDGTRIRFHRWMGVGSGSYTGEDPTFQIVMNNPITETAEWLTQYYLKIISEMGNPVGEGWYNANELVTFSVDSTATVNDSVRYSFAGWIGSGMGSYSGDDIMPSIVLQGPVEEIASWVVQYYVTLQVDPPGSGTVLPFGIPGGWATALDSLQLIAVGLADSAYGFSSWSGDTISTDNPLWLVIGEPMELIAHFKKGVVIIATDPEGLFITVDGLEILAPVVYNWVAGEEHIIGTLSPQGDGVTSRYIYTEWSDGGGQEHGITVPADPIIYTVSFSASYFLKIQSDYGNPVGEGWYNVGDQTDVWVNQFAEESDEIRRKFVGWVGIGEGSVTSQDTSITVVVQGPVTERAEWDPQFKLDVRTFPPYTTGITIQTDPTGPWYDPGTEVQLTISMEDTSYTFTGWSGAIDATTNPVTVTVQGPMEVVANFYVPNLPPVIVDVPQITLMEDETVEKSFVWLNQYIQDPNDPIEALTFLFETGPHIQVSIDTIGKFIVIAPEENWSGTESFFVEVTDPYGLSDSDTFIVNILPVNDPPEPFGLISPPQDTSLTEWLWPMAFMWEQAMDIDEGDTVSYTFYYSPSQSLSGPGTIAVSFLADTVILLNIQGDGTYYWGVWAEDLSKERVRCTEVFQISIQTSVETHREGSPTQYCLSQNFPNPFNPQTTIQYQLPKSEQVNLLIFDIRGALVRNLVDGKKEAGYHQVLWDGKDENGRSVSSGMYFVRIQAGRFIQRRKMLLIR